MLDTIVCYICYEQETPTNPYALNPRPCPCKGSIEIHKTCLQAVLKSTHNCSICKFKYDLTYLPKKDGRELIIETLPNGGQIEYTLNEANQIHGSYTVKNIEGNTVVYHSYINGIMEGPYVEYYPNGQIHSVCRCNNNKIEGEFTEWYSDGSVKEEAFYINGKKHGECIRWKRNGFTRASKIILYEDGEIVSPLDIHDDY